MGGVLSCLKLASCRMGVVIAVVVILSGCQASGGSSAPPPISAKAASPPVPSPSSLSGGEAVVAVYRDLYSSGQLAERTPANGREPILARVAAQPLLNRMLRGIAALQATDRVTWGSPVIHTFNVAIKDDRATLHDCQDATGTGQADAKTGERLTHGKSGTHLVATLRKGKDGAWRISTLEQVKEPCSPAA